MTGWLASIKLFMELLTQAKALYAFYQKNREEQWFQSSLKIFNELSRQDRTIDEKKKSISDLAKLLGDM